MSADSRNRNPVDFKLIRALTGKRRPGEIDVEGAIDASSSRATLSDLTRRGYSAVSVVDLRKVEAIIRQAVGEAIERRTVAFIEVERQKIEDESLRRIEQMLQEQNVFVARGNPPPDIPASAHRPPTEQPPLHAPHPPGYQAPAMPFDLAGLGQMITNIVRTELCDAMQHGPAAPQPIAAEGLSEIIAKVIRAELGSSRPAPTGAELDDRVSKLIEVLQRAEQTASKLSSWGGGGAPRRYQRRSAADYFVDKKRSEMLEQIFTHNVQLQMLGAGMEARTDAAQPAQAMPQPGGETQ